MICKKHIILLLSVLSFLLHSCTEPYEVDLDSTYTRLVVDGFITTDTSQHTIRLTLSADYFANQAATPASGASVSVYDGVQAVVFAEDPDVPGNYLSPAGYAGVPGRTYRLSISGLDVDSDGQDENYTAENDIVDFMQPDSILFVPVFAREDTNYVVSMFMPNPPGKDYLMFRTYVNGELVTDTLNNTVVYDDELFTPGYIAGLPVSFLSARNERTRVQYGDTITIEMFAMTKESYDFLNELFQAVSYQNPIFSGPPANVKTHIVGGNATGYFHTYNAFRVSAILSEDKIVRRK